MDNPKHDVACLLLLASGEQVDLNRIEEHSIPIDVIAHSLSHTCRFSGHGRRFYSVAQHSINAAHLLLNTLNDPSLALAGLLHDAAEVFIGDIPSPVKGLFGSSVAQLEERIVNHVYKTHGVPFSTIPESVHIVDRILLHLEMLNLYDTPPGWVQPVSFDEVYPSTHSMSHATARRVFLELYDQLRGDVCPPS